MTNNKINTNNKYFKLIIIKNQTKYIKLNFKNL